MSSATNGHARAGTAASYPLAPWRLQGPFAFLLMPVPMGSARERLPEGLHAISAGPGRTLGGLVLARYQGESTLHYSELIVFAALAGAHGRAGFWVSHIYVDDDRSMAGGREIWGLPKEMAEFSWGEDGVVSVAQDGRALVRAELPRRGRRLDLPLPTAAWGGSAGDLRFASGVGTMRAAPARPSIEIPPRSPFADVGFGSVLSALVGVADVPFPAPQVFRS